jgi:K+-sensing histidine kinase KdpD
VEFARRNQASQIFVGRSHGGLRERLFGRHFGEDICRIAHDLQVTVVTDRTGTYTAEGTGEVEW